MEMIKNEVGTKKKKNFPSFIILVVDIDIDF